MIASHYAEPLLRHLAAPAQFHRAAARDSEVVAELEAGDEFWLLDDGGGWAWGYAGKDRRAGYARAETIGS